MGWRRRQEWPGPRHRTGLSPGLSGCLPTPPTVWPSLKEDRRWVTNHPQSSFNTEGGREAPAKDVRAVGVWARGCQTPLLIKQTACRHLSPGSSFEERCPEGAPGVPPLRGWRGWATDQPLWPVLPGTCQILEEKERGWGVSRGQSWGWGGWAGPGPTTFTGDALGLFCVIPLRKQKEGAVSWTWWGRAGLSRKPGQGPETPPHPFLSLMGWGWVGGGAGEGARWLACSRVLQKRTCTRTCTPTELRERKAPAAVRGVVHISFLLYREVPRGWGSSAAEVSHSNAPIVTR